MYCFTQKESEEVTRELRQQGIKTGCYHASIPAKQKSQIHEMWLADKILVSFIFILITPDNQLLELTMFLCPGTYHNYVPPVKTVDQF